MKESHKTILITGSNGLIGKILKQRLCEYKLVEFDASVDLSDFKLLEENLDDSELIDCIIHLAADSCINSPWESILKNNIIVTRNVFEFAKERGIKKVIFASSNHVTGLYEGIPPSLHLIKTRERLIDKNMPLRPDSYYAVSKIFGETLGIYFSEIYDMSVICLRIGSVLENDKPTINKRCRSTWLSHSDLVQLIKVSIESEVKFGIYYGVSNNTRRFWDISDARKELGYEPVDNAEESYKNN